MKIILPIVIFTLIETTALASSLRTEKHPPPEADVKSFSRGGNDNQQRGDNIEEAKECIPANDPRVRAASANAGGLCKHNLCSDGCCRHDTEFLACDQNNAYPDLACVCNGLTDNGHLDNSDEDENCGDGELNFDFAITSDNYVGQEITWELVNSQDQLVAIHTTGTIYNAQFCIPDDCYTLSLCCGGIPEYTLAVDGTTVAQNNGVITYSGTGIIYDFGSCEAPPTPEPTQDPPTLEPFLDNNGFLSDFGGCIVEIEMVCDDIVDELSAVPSLYNVDLEESMSSQLVDCELTIYGKGFNDIHLTDLEMLSNVFDDQNISDALDGEPLTPDMTYVVEFTIEINPTISQRYIFFSTLTGETDGGEECFAATDLEFTVGNPLS